MIPFNIEKPFTPEQVEELREKTKENYGKLTNIRNNTDLTKVDHPNHYNRPDAIECIDEMILIFGKAAVMNFCLLNAWKYRYRAADKNGEEDLYKSDWYIKKYKELLEMSN